MTWKCLQLSEFLFYWIVIFSYDVCLPKEIICLGAFDMKFLRDFPKLQSPAEVIEFPSRLIDIRPKLSFCRNDGYSPFIFMRPASVIVF